MGIASDVFLVIPGHLFQTKQNKTKQSKTKQNKTKQNKTKHSARLKNRPWLWNMTFTEVTEYPVFNK